MEQSERLDQGRDSTNTIGATRRHARRARLLLAGACMVVALSAGRVAASPGETQPARPGAMVGGLTDVDIQSQLDAGRRVVDLEGDYVIGNPISVPSGVLIRGNATLRAAGAAIVLDVADATDVRIDGITIDGADEAMCISLSGTRRVRITGVTARLCRPIGILAMNATDTTIRDAVVSECWNDGISVKGHSRRTLIDGGSSFDNGRDPDNNGNGIDLNTGGKEAIVRAIRVWGNDGSGIVVEAGPNSDAEQWAANDVQIVAVHSFDNAGNGLEWIRKTPGPYPARGTVLGGVFGPGNTLPGIRADGHGLQIVGAAVWGNDGHGVVVPDTARDVLVDVYCADNGRSLPLDSGACVYVDGRRIRVDAHAQPGTSDLVYGDDDVQAGNQRRAVHLAPNARAVSVGPRSSVSACERECRDATASGVDGGCAVIEPGGALVAVGLLLFVFGRRRAVRA